MDINDMSAAAEAATTATTTSTVSTTTTEAHAQIPVNIAADPANECYSLTKKLLSSKIVSESTLSPTSESSKNGMILGIWLRIFRCLLVDMVMLILFILFVTTMVIHKLHDDYFYPQLELMVWDGRDGFETTYYHRHCTGKDFTATSAEELVITDNYTAQDAANHMMTHGASLYPNLLTNETASVLREWIVRENQVRDGWFVIENNNRWSWGIHMDMHPTLQTFWQELAANQKLVTSLEKIVGPNPAVIEFTAITSACGATTQRLHADVVPEGSATKYARSFVTSYSLFIPLQDTTYEMGATHVCPGSHICSEGVKKLCDEKYALAMSGPKGQGGAWKMGWGALVNQQTFHRGTEFTQEGAPDRVVLIATFAPRPIYERSVETRMIGHGGSYSLLWNQWGHTFYDYVHANYRMREPLSTLRSLGVIKGHGINFLSSASMRMANEESAMTEDDLEELIEEGGLFFLPESWQGSFGEKSDISSYHAFVYGSIKKTEKEIGRITMMVTAFYLVVALLWDVLKRLLLRRRSSSGSAFLRTLLRVLIMNGLVVLLAWTSLRTVEDSRWGKSIRAGKAYNLPWMELGDQSLATLPHRNDVLMISHYASDYLASYSKVIDYAHPGNKFWNQIVKEHVHGYTSLSTNLKERYCEALIEYVIVNRRFLMQDVDRRWYHVSDMEKMTKFCRDELAKANHPLLKTLSHQLDALRSETEFGSFRTTAMHSLTIPTYLDLWDNRFLPQLQLEHTPSSNVVLTATKARRSSLIPTWTSLARLTPKSKSGHKKRKNALPPKPLPRPPTEAAWLEEGDRVRAKFNCNKNGKGKYFPGVISAVYSHSAMYEIDYDDGDSNEVLQGCLVPFDH